jgi:hypothetical protein
VAEDTQDVRLLDEMSVDGDGSGDDQDTAEFHEIQNENTSAEVVAGTIHTEDDSDSLEQPKNVLDLEEIELWYVLVSSCSKLLPLPLLLLDYSYLLEPLCPLDDEKKEVQRIS